jgi:hypothetical protein
MTIPARAAALLAAGLLAGALPGARQAAGGGAPEKPWTLEKPAPAVELKPKELADLAGESCGECHAALVAEWRGTAHAIAWVDEVYKEEIADRKRPESCHGCHIPKSIVADGLAKKAEAREETKNLGISCQSCHLGPSGAMLGPWGAPTSAHATAVSENVSGKGSSAMCAVCHSTNIGPVVGIAKDFFTSKMEDRGRSCVGCHMAVVEREPSKGAAEGATKRSGRSHEIQTPRDPKFLARAFEPSLKVDGGTFTVTIRNLAGHRVPGLIGRSIVFQAELQDIDGKKVASAELTLDARAYMAVDGSSQIPIPGKGSSVHLKGLHNDPRRTEPVEFLDVQLKPSGH